MKYIHLTIFLLFLTTSNAFAEIAMSKTTFKRLQNIEGLIAKEQLVKAENKLTNFLQNPPLRDIDKAYLFYTAGMFYLQDNYYKKSTNLLKKAHSLKSLPNKTTLYILQTLAELSMQNEKMSEAIKYYKQYIKLAPKPEKHIYLGLGTAYFYKKDYKNSIQILKRAKKLFGHKKSIYLMLFSSYYELKQLQNATNILEEMIRIWASEKKYWLQLSSLYIERKKYSKALEIMQLTLAKGFKLKERDILQYSYILYEKKLPFKSAKTIQENMNKGIVVKNQKNYELLATMYQEAKEKNKAINALKKAAEYSTNGKNNLYIAQLYFEQENQFRKVIKHAKKAIVKGIKQTGSAHMLIAVAYSELEQINKAKKHLKQALKYKKTKNSAQQWLKNLKKVDN